MPLPRSSAAFCQPRFRKKRLNLRPKKCCGREHAACLYCVCRSKLRGNQLHTQSQDSCSQLRLVSVSLLSIFSPYYLVPSKSNIYNPRIISHHHACLSKYWSPHHHDFFGFANSRHRGRVRGEARVLVKAAGKAFAK